MNIFRNIQQICLSMLMFLLFTSQLEAAVKPLYVSFYQQKIALVFDDEIQKQQLPSQFNYRAPEQFAKAMQQTPYQVLVKSLQQQKEKMQLNDWMYYLLVKQTTDQLFNKYSDNTKTLTAWFFMAKSGYKVRLLHNGKQAWLHAAFNHKVFELSYVEIGKGKYVNLTAFHTVKGPLNTRLTDSDILYNIYGKNFSFKMEVLPKISAPLVGRKILSFHYKGVKHEVPVEVDKNIVAFWRIYPKLSLYSYTDVPMSNIARNSVLPALRQIIDGKEVTEQVRILMSFTRQAFKYETDMDAYNEPELVFTPEQTLFAPASDCEDRAILLHFLVRELLGLKAVLVELPHHVAIAINFNEPIGNYMEIDGKPYSFCEATGPQDFLEIGELSPDYQPAQMKLLAWE